MPAAADGRQRRTVTPIRASAAPTPCDARHAAGRPGPPGRVKAEGRIHRTARDASRQPQLRQFRHADVFASQNQACPPERLRHDPWHQLPVERAVGLWRAHDRRAEPLRQNQRQQLVNDPGAKPRPGGSLQVPARHHQRDQQVGPLIAASSALTSAGSHAAGLRYHRAGATNHDIPTARTSALRAVRRRCETRSSSAYRRIEPRFCTPSKYR